MPNPFNDAQAQAADSGYGYEPQPPSADLSGAQAPPAGGMDPTRPKFYEGSPSELGQLRDSIMAQFPTINDVDDETMDGNQQAALFAIALANPKGALDMIRDKKDRQLKKRQQAAEFNMHAMTLASHVMDAQNQMSLGMATLRQREAEAKMSNDYHTAIQETERGRLRVEQTRADIAQSEARRHATAQDMAMSMMTEGTDAGGQEMSAPPGTPGFTSRATSMGLSPSINERGLSMAPARRGTDTSVSFRRDAASELSARKTGQGRVNPQFQGMADDELLQIVSPTNDFLTLQSRRREASGNSPAAVANRPAPSFNPADLEANEPDLYEQQVGGQ